MAEKLDKTSYPQQKNYERALPQLLLLLSLLQELLQRKERQRLLQLKLEKLHTSVQTIAPARGLLHQHLPVQPAKIS